MHVMKEDGMKTCFTHTYKELGRKDSTIQDIKVDRQNREFPSVEGHSLSTVSKTVTNLTILGLINS